MTSFSAFVLLSLASVTLAAPIPTDEFLHVQLRYVDEIDKSTTLDPAYPLAPLSSVQMNFAQGSSTLFSDTVTTATPTLPIPTPTDMMVYELDLVASSDPDHPYTTELITYMPTSTPTAIPDTSTLPQIQGLGVAVSEPVSSSSAEGGFLRDASLLQKPMPIPTSHISSSSFSHVPLSTHLLHPTPMAGAAKVASTVADTQSEASTSTSATSSLSPSGAADGMVILDILTIPMPSHTHSPTHITSKPTSGAASQSITKASSKTISHSTRPHRTTTVHTKLSTVASPRPTPAFGVASYNDSVHIDDAQLPPLLSKHSR